MKPVNSYTTAELYDQGWTRHAITKFLGPEPDACDVFTSRRRRIVRYYYDADRVNAAWPQLESWRKQRDVRLSVSRRSREASFDRKYREKWRLALPDACAGLVDLNRYAKHSKCTSANRDEIYALKARFIELLYRNGDCTDCYHHETQLQEKLCFCM